MAMSVAGLTCFYREGRAVQLTAAAQRNASLNKELPSHKQLMSHFLCSNHYNGAWTESFQLPRDPINFIAYPLEMTFKPICNI